MNVPLGKFATVILFSECANYIL